MLNHTVSHSVGVDRSTVLHWFLINDCDATWSMNASSSAICDGTGRLMPTRLRCTCEWIQLEHVVQLNMKYMYVTLHV